MNPLAQELNQALANSVAERLLSDFGKRMFFPKGIIAQSAEAKEKGKLYDVTIGIATTGGKAMILDGIKNQLPTLSPNEAVAYAPTPGFPALRKRWLEGMKRKNPSLDAANVSLPAVVPGLTAGVNYALELFLNPDERLVCPDMYWENYSLIVRDRLGSDFVNFSTFTPSGGFDVPAFEKALRAGAKNGKVAFILNFPNNPSGYSPTKAEAGAIVAAVKKLADEGLRLCAITDDAYFGLFYEDDVEKESLFARLSSLSPNVLAVKVDGPTKEDYSWGFRSGFITFGAKGMSQPQYEALVKKLMGAIRSSVSSSSSVGQNLLLKAMDTPGYEENKLRFGAIMQERYVEARAVLASLSSARIRPLPFNSGYFMCFECSGIDAEALRQKLLNEYGIGTIALGAKSLRVAFSSIEKANLRDCYTKIYEAAEKL
jgi:aspartate/methionine/tyrosine aminotransferase